MRASRAEIKIEEILEKAGLVFKMEYDELRVEKELCIGCWTI